MVDYVVNKKKNQSCNEKDKGHSTGDVYQKNRHRRVTVDLYKIMEKLVSFCSAVC